MERDTGYACKIAYELKRKIVKHFKIKNFSEDMGQVLT